ncbi:NUDIX domain-containing protein [Pseudomonas sp. p50]|nr:NUDIX domain-containing protein [Pseudomonas sp. p50(2008)]MBF4560115.1 NUDIX domain-containing protein [Pseudomonas sp. p50(2008)]
MRPDKACAVILSSEQHPRILLFHHPQAGVQLVKGSIERGETPNRAALRELAEESGISAATIEDDLGCWNSGHQDRVRCRWNRTFIGTTLGPGRAMARQS